MAWVGSHQAGTPSPPSPPPGASALGGWGSLGFTFISSPTAPGSAIANFPNFCKVKPGAHGVGGVAPIGGATSAILGSCFRFFWIEKYHEGDGEKEFPGKIHISEKENFIHNNVNRWSRPFLRIEFCLALLLEFFENSVAICFTDKIRPWGFLWYLLEFREEQMTAEFLKIVLKRKYLRGRPWFNSASDTTIFWCFYCFFG